jgi:hypothetical protein
MNANPSSWYIGVDNQPTGPFTAQELLKSWQAGTLDENTLSWCEGMAEWLPLSQVAPFAAQMPSASVPATPPHTITS